MLVSMQHGSAELMRFESDILLMVSACTKSSEHPRVAANLRLSDYTLDEAGAVGCA